jgi:hypothetical protein
MTASLIALLFQKAFLGFACKSLVSGVIWHFLGSHIILLREQTAGYQQGNQHHERAPSSQRDIGNLSLCRGLAEGTRFL